jgi:hypothetical protein
MSLPKNDQVKIAEAYHQVLNEGIFKNLFNKNKTNQQQPAQPSQPSQPEKKITVKVFGEPKTFSEKEMLKNSKVIDKKGDDDDFIEFRLFKTVIFDYGEKDPKVDIFIPFMRFYRDEYPNLLDAIYAKNLNVYHNMQDAMNALNTMKSQNS